jgi:hypothetical protein
MTHEAAPIPSQHGRPQPAALTTNGFKPGSSAAESSSTLIDCDTCTARGTACGDCVVTVLLGGPPLGVTLNEEERRALEVLADAGLIPPLRLSAGAEVEVVGSVWREYTDDPGADVAAVTRGSSG